MKETIVIAFMGDIMIGRMVNETIETQGDTYPWGNMLPYLQKTDLNVINLEATLTKSTRRVPKVFNFKASPDRVETLLAARIDLVNLANNHILDFSEEGLIETIEVLDNAGILHTGAGIDEAQARKPAVILKKGITVGVLGYTDNEPGWVAGTDRPGTNYIEVGDIQKLREDIEKVRDKVDILVVSIHWGPNMRERPTPSFMNFAHQIIESGADIIHGHSAHIFQGMERYNGKLIMYDTGDFIDDYAVDEFLRNDLSFLFCVEVDKKAIRRIELVPIAIDNMQVNRAKEDDEAWLVETLKERSAGFGISVRKVKEGIEIV